MKTRACFVAMTLTLVCGLYATAQSIDYKIIVHPDNPENSISKGFVSRLFLKKVTSWDHGQSVDPVDLDYASSVRTIFTKEIHKKSISAVRSYWQQQIYSGRKVPPPMKNTDNQVIHYVLSHPGAIGYVSPEAKLGRAKELEIKD